MNEQNIFDEAVDLEESSRLSIGLSTLVSSGRAPGPNEVPYIKKVLSRLEDREKDIIQELKRLEESLSRIQTKQTSLRSLRAPIRRLPPELLAIILVFVVEATEGWESNRGSEFQKWELTGIVLSKVCIHWRNTAIATPEIWNTIQLHLEADRVAKDDHAKIRLCVSRSRDQPISLLVSHSRLGILEVVEKGGLDIPGELMGQFHRVRRLQLSGLSHVFLRRYGANLGQLQELRFPHSLESGPQLKKLFDTVGQFCPNIEHFDVRMEFGLPPLIKDTALPFSKITNFTFAYCSCWDTDAVLSFIQRFRNLKQLNMTMPCLNIGYTTVTSGPTTQNEYSCIALPQLTQLVIQVNDASNRQASDAELLLPSIKMLKAITAPSLVSFSMTVRHILPSRDSSALIDAVEAFLRRSSDARTLRSLSLRGIPLNDYQVMPILRMARGLKELVLGEAAQEGSEGWNTSLNLNICLATLGFMHGLTSFRRAPSGQVPDDPDRLLPFLRHLELTVVYKWSSKQWSSFGNMIKSRLPVLQSVILNGAGSIEKRNIQDLMTLQKEGLAIRVAEYANEDASGRKRHYVLDYGGSQSHSAPTPVNKFKGHVTSLRAIRPETEMGLAHSRAFSMYYGHSIGGSSSAVTPL